MSQGVFLDAGRLLETTPRRPLPAGLSPQDHRRLNQLDHLEHMAMMVMAVEQQLEFFRKPAEERVTVVQALLPTMSEHWPNLRNKHAEMGHERHVQHRH